jgi:hypothetical protein
MFRQEKCWIKRCSNIFWTDSAAALSGRALPTITLGFDGGTGVHTDSSKYRAQISLQFQIFKPTGQSYMDVAVGQSSGPVSVTGNRLAKLVSTLR